MQVSRSLFADLKIPDTDEPILPDFMPLDAPLQPTLSDVVSDKVRGLAHQHAECKVWGGASWGSRGITLETGDTAYTLCSSVQPTLTSRCCNYKAQPRVMFILVPK